MIHVRTDVSEEPSASIMGVIRIGELGTTVHVTSNRRPLRRNKKSLCISSQRASVYENVTRDAGSVGDCLKWLEALFSADSS
jgi:hypothetical protein